MRTISNFFIGFSIIFLALVLANKDVNIIINNEIKQQTPTIETYVEVPPLPATENNVSVVPLVVEEVVKPEIEEKREKNHSDLNQSITTSSVVVPEKKEESEEVGSSKSYEEIVSDIKRREEKKKEREKEARVIVAPAMSYEENESDSSNNDKYQIGGPDAVGNGHAILKASKDPTIRTRTEKDENSSLDKEQTDGMTEFLKNLKGFR